jgi:hypothetical protein
MLKFEITAAHSSGRSENFGTIHSISAERNRDFISFTVPPLIVHVNKRVLRRIWYLSRAVTRKRPQEIQLEGLKNTL